MKTTKRVARKTPAPRWQLNEKTAPPILALGAMVVVILLTLAFHAIIKPKPETVTEKKTTSSAIEISTADHITLTADLLYPQGRAPFPVIILVHEFGQDRTEWNSYREMFLSEGLAVMSYDIRGFGASALTAIPAAQSGWFASMPNDVTAVVQYLQHQPKINADKIFIMGAGLGANIAYVASGSVTGIAKTVLLSPSVNSQLDGSTVDNFFPRNIYGLANESERTTVEDLLRRASGENQTMFLPDATARGLLILQDEEARGKILTWLKQ